MGLNVEDIKNQWEIDQPKYIELEKIIFTYFKENINQIEILPEISSRTKNLISIIKKIKKKLLKKDEYSYDSLNDKLGLRIICDFQEDMIKVDDFIKDNFKIENIEYKQEELDFNKLGYISNHYDLKLKEKHSLFVEFEQLKDLIFEVQVKTLNQHAWSNTAHKLSYKQNIALPPNIKRKIYRLLSLYEIADDEFSAVNKLLSDTPTDVVFSLINILEGKIFKYANIDYDREISNHNLSIIMSYLPEKEKENVYNEIEKFITSNEEKIKTIFLENKERYYLIPLLTQPEVFVIWYSLKHFQFSIIDNWPNDFDLNELEQIANLWGTSIY